jgi:lipoprotein-releasing system permease protein
MFSAFEWMIALRYLRSRRGDGFISVIAGFSLVGICLGVAVLIVVMAVMNGFREELLDRILGMNGHAAVAGYGGQIEGYESLARQIRDVDGVISVTPLIEGQVMATTRGIAAGAILRGVGAAEFRNHEQVAPNLTEGSLEYFGEPGTVVIGFRLARQLGVGVGDQITLISPQGTATPFGTAPRMQAFDIIATFEVGIYDYDNLFIFLPLEDAQVYYRMGNSVTGIEIFVDDPDNLDAIRPKIDALIFEVGVLTDWRQLNQSLFSALQVERNVMFLILTLIIVVAAFNIISSLIMLVKDKSRDVAILRTMGASRFSVMRIFIIAGASVGVVGTLLGVALGLTLAINIDSIQLGLEALTGTELWNAEIRFLSEMPARLEAGEVIVTVAIALGLSLLATLPPSWRAAKLEPVDVLRLEG